MPPAVDWYEDARQLLCECLGEEAFCAAAAALAVPPTCTCVRVNTLVAEPAAIARELEELTGGARVTAASPDLPEALLVHGCGAQDVDVSPACGRELAVDRRCAEAVLRGADVFVPGVFGCSAGVEENVLVAVTAVIEPLGQTTGCGMTRGFVLPRTPSGRLLLGLGRTVLSRGQIFRANEGLAVIMEHRMFEQRVTGERILSALRGRVMLQNLPSIVAARALSPAPGDRVLDMCASPGGKTSALAALMHNRGCIVALDVNQTKVNQIRALCCELGATIVSAHKMDATKSVLVGADADAPSEAEQAYVQARGDSGRAAGGPKLEARKRRKAAGAAARGNALCERDTSLCQPQDAQPTQAFPLGSFDAILCDAPCSALGLRPRLSQPVNAAQLRRFASYQRALLHAAVALLRPGGALVFSTCTISPLENEANVGWLLATFPDMQLQQPAVRLGGPGLTAPACGGDPWLTPQQADLVQRFRPETHDTIGFFVARFVKRARTE